MSRMWARVAPRTRGYTLGDTVPLRLFELRPEDAGSTTGRDIDCQQVLGPPRGRGSPPMPMLITTKLDMSAPPTRGSTHFCQHSEPEAPVRPTERG